MDGRARFPGHMADRAGIPVHMENEIRYPADRAGHQEFQDNGVRHPAESGRRQHRRAVTDSIRRRRQRADVP